MQIQWNAFINIHETHKYRNCTFPMFGLESVRIIAHLQKRVEFGRAIA